LVSTLAVLPAQIGLTLAGEAFGLARKMVEGLRPYWFGSAGDRRHRS
jgi:hypothetical protein